MRQSVLSRVLRGLFLLVVGLFFVVPLYSMVDFSTRDIRAGSGRTLEAWALLVQDRDLFASIITSLLLSVATVLAMFVILVPTMVWVQLRVAWAKRIIEFICLLPLAIPALVIVVGIKNVMLWLNYFVGHTPFALTFPYVILLLPYAFRSIDAALSAMDANTLAEAARSLGASWFTVIVKIIGPNIRTGMLSAAFIGIALVLGEYTFASLLHYDTLPPQIVVISKAEARTSVAASFAMIAFTSALLLGLGFLTRERRTKEGSVA
jgi:putative spermidine/putrescine transport system permease protein